MRMSAAGARRQNVCNAGVPIRIKYECLRASSARTSRHDFCNRVYDPREITS